MEQLQGKMRHKKDQFNCFGIFGYAEDLTIMIRGVSDLI
jgi:hypothetical protein